MGPPVLFVDHWIVGNNWIISKQDFEMFHRFGLRGDAADV